MTLQVQRAEPISDSAICLAGKRIGWGAGWGSFPVEIARRCVANQAQLFTVGLQGHADPALQHLSTDFRWMGVAKLGGHIRYFLQHQVSHVALAGKLFKDQLLFHGWGWMGLLPDLGCLRAMAPIFVTRSRDARDDSILGSVVQAYEKAGIQMMAVHQIAPGLLIEHGIVAGKPPTSKQWSDICLGWQVAKQMGDLDIGQSVMVKDQMVLAVEAIEGTDSLIQRTGGLCPRGGFVLVKVAKPHQDMRFDVPTVGPLTVEQMAKAGGKLIAIEAEKTIVVDREQTLQAASKFGVSIVALNEHSVKLKQLHRELRAA